MGHADAYLRLLAGIAQQSVPRRATAALTRSLPVLGIAPIRVAGDDRIQALAVGPIEGPPLVSVLVDPYQRDPGHFAEIGEYLAELCQSRHWQLWLPDAAAATVLGLEGIRNRRNPAASASRQFLARFCWAAHLTLQRPGQQVIAVATQVLGQHLVTGQSPTEDAHLWARLAWDHPVPGADPAVAAASRRQRAGPTLAPFHDDELIEKVRAQNFLGVASAADRKHVASLLEAAALHSWTVLVEAFRAYEALELPDLPGLSPVIQQSLKTFDWMLQVSPAFGASAGATTREFQLREYLHEQFEDIDVRGDRIQREVFRAQGRVIAARVLRLRAASRKRGTPCRILLRSEQALRRFRVGTALKTQDDRVEGRVEAIRHTGSAVLFILRVTRGGRAARSLEMDKNTDWFDTVVFPGPWLKRRNYHAAS